MKCTAVEAIHRLDGEDKEYGFIVDYKDLFRSLEQSIKDYTGEAFEGYDADDVRGLLKDRLQQGRERLEEAREAVKALCEPVDPPRDSAAYLRFFCAVDSGDARQLKANERKRVALYKLAASFLRAYANLANEMHEAGYSDTETTEIKAEAEHYEKVRQEVKLASGDYVDMKVFEPAMRHLLDTYIRAEESETVSAFDDLTLVELIIKRGEAAIDALPEGIQGSREAIAETIENNVRRLIIDESSVNPKYYEKMSDLLDALILQRKQEALDYKEYLAKIVELTQRIGRPETGASYPANISSPALRALYDNLDNIKAWISADGESRDRKETAIEIDLAVQRTKKADWRGHKIKEREVRRVIKTVLGEREDEVDAIFEIVKAQSDY